MGSTIRRGRAFAWPALTLVLPALVAAGAAGAGAAEAIAPATPYVQTFDTLAVAGTANAWTDEVTIAGWSATATTYRASTGSDTTGAMYSYGTGSDRALGGLRSTTVGDLAFGVRIRNEGVAAIDGLAVAYAGEQWRDSGNLAAQRLSFAYRIGAGGDLATGDWTPVPDLDFVSPVTSGGASALDGNTADHRRALDASLGVVLAPGEEITLRWTDVNDAGTDHGLAIDDLAVTVERIVDLTPPVLTLPSAIEAVASGPDGAGVDYEASAHDDLDGDVPVTCRPPSGSTFPPGETSVGCAATDATGNLVEGWFPVGVSYAFQGFFPPIDAGVANLARAGAAVPIKFSLGGDMGLGVIRRITRDQVACGELATADAVEETASAGASSLSYDPTTETYTYVWKTEKAWATSPSRCRQLDVHLFDGSHHVAWFAFTR